MLHTLPTFWKFFSQQKKMVANVFFANFHPQRASPSVDPAPSNSSICLVSLKTSGSWSKTMKLKALPKNQRFWWFFLWEHNRKCIRWTMASAIYFHTRVYICNIDIICRINVQEYKEIELTCQLYATRSRIILVIQGVLTIYFQMRSKIRGFP